MRLHLTKKTELALRTMQHLDRNPRAKSADLAAAVGTTSGFVPQVLQPLVASGWVTSMPGPTGGYELHVDLSTVSLLELIEACEGPTDDGQCVLIDRACPIRDRCALHEPWVRARASLSRELAATDLAALPVQLPERTTRDCNP